MNFYIDYNNKLFSHKYMAWLFWLVHRTFKDECHAYSYGSVYATPIVEDAEQMMLMGPMQEEIT